MIISFLQRRDPPVLPALQTMENAHRSVVDGQVSAFADDLSELKGFGAANRESDAELLFQFFRHYGYEIQYSVDVMSVKQGRLLTRAEKGYPKDRRLCVEEPFNPSRNLGNSADDYSFSGIHQEIRRAFELLADGCQLEKCCEEFVFPPEPEKPLFQRPIAKPKPTLTRSASQSGGRANHENGPTRRNGKARNQSAHRAGNRRASSGAAYSAQRGTFLQSPALGLNAMDNFAKSNLHEQLYQQYQSLQFQQDLLRNQLVQQQASQQAQAHAVAHAGDLAGINATHRRLQFPPGTLTAQGRHVNDAPQTAPLAPTYLYSYQNRFMPPSPLQHQNGQRSREGTSTNPSSPSLVAPVPALRRQSQRTSVTDGSNGSIRSQSQPGRPIHYLPYNFTLQQYQQYAAQQGLDLTSVANGQYRGPNVYGHGIPNGVPFPPMPDTQHISAVSNGDTARPKEYVGYYVGQSPQLGPLQGNHNRMQVPTMPGLRDPPQCQRRVTPDLQLPMPNGRHVSRSPSPLGHLRSYSTAGDLRAARAQSTASLEPPMPAPMPSIDLGGPLIVNGSTPVLPKPMHRSNGALTGSMGPPPIPADPFRGFPLPLRMVDSNSSDQESYTDRGPPSPRISPSPRTKIAPRLSLSPNGKALPINGVGEPYADIPPLSAAPLLSPVAELRTPSPTHARLFDGRESPQRLHTNGGPKSATLVNGSTSHREENNKPVPKLETRQHERKASIPSIAPVPGERLKPQSHSPATHNSANGALDKNPWQQAPTRKGHKKSKSTAAAGHMRSNGEPMPVNEHERKGG
jgi:hypothetical protein